MPAGRPSEYTPEIAERICDLVATTRMSMIGICRKLTEEGYEVSKSAVFSWLRRHKEFEDEYTRAKEHQRYVFEDGIREESANECNDWEFRPNYNGPAAWQVNGTAINRSRLIVDSDKWLMSKLWPKKYGEAQQIDMTVKGGMDNTLKIEFVEPKKTAE